MEGENNFLCFLPIENRRELCVDWYKDDRKSAENYIDDQFRGLERTTRVVFQSDDPKEEFFHTQLLTISRV